LKREGEEDENPPVEHPERIDAAQLLRRVRQLEMELADSRDEIKGVLESKISFKQALQRVVLATSEQCMGIDNAFKMMLKPKVPWNLIALVVIGVAIIGMFSANPQYVEGLGVYLSSQQNQMFVALILLAIAGISYLYVRRRRSTRG
jgi:hypothetical protein